MQTNNQPALAEAKIGCIYNANLEKRFWVRINSKCFGASENSFFHMHA